MKEKNIITIEDAINLMHDYKNLFNGNFVKYSIAYGTYGENYVIRYSEEDKDYDFNLLNFEIVSKNERYKAYTPIMQSGLYRYMYLKYGEDYSKRYLKYWNKKICDKNNDKLSLKQETREQKKKLSKFVGKLKKEALNESKNAEENLEN